MNSHRYFLYLAIILAILHWYHAFESYLRTAQTAHITIVDEVTRCLPLLSDFIKDKNGLDVFDNKECLRDVLNYISDRLKS